MTFDRTAYAREWYQKNKERKAEQTQRYRDKNPEKVQAQRRRFDKNNPDKMKRCRQRWEAKNPWYFAYNSAMAFARANNRLPKWLTRDDIRRMKEIYKNCPEGMQVDHIYPLQGAHCSGFHHPDNLQYLTSSENKRKGNRLLQ